ncbi:hypothetical protein [Actinocrispum sp. NPDC049592]|uniref:hypothetical protein n=1 Tax=Actinocrispum sp. NPDC049592 TaxID=3154835 RepID=UPI00341E073E
MDYLVPQHDGRAERAEQLAAVRAAYRYNMDFGFPVSAGMRDFTNTRVSAAHKNFINELTSIEDTGRITNKRRPLAYPYLQPSLIPNSTNI